MLRKNRIYKALIITIFLNNFGDVVLYIICLIKSCVYDLCELVDDAIELSAL